MEFDFLELTQALECSFSERVALRPVALCDAWPLFAATRNPLFNRHLLWPRPEREEQLLKRVRMIMEASRRGRLTALSAVARNSGEFIALFRFQPHATLFDTIEMGVWVLVGEDGRTYQISGGRSSLLKEGQRVEIDGDVDDGAVSVAMVGPVLRVRSYKVV